MRHPRLPRSDKLRPNTWEWAMAVLREAAAEFHAAVDLTRCGAPAGGGRTFPAFGFRHPGLGLDACPIPDPFVDRLADRLGVGGVSFRREAMPLLFVRQAVRNTILLARRADPQALPDCFRFNAHGREFLHLQYKTEDLLVLWSVRVTIPDEFKRVRPTRWIREERT